MLHRDDAATARDAVEPADLIIEPDDSLKQDEDAARPKPAETHHHSPPRGQKWQPDRADYHGPGEEGKIERESPCPLHQRISDLAGSGSSCTVLGEASRAAGLIPSTKGRTRVAKYLLYSTSSNA